MGIAGKTWEELGAVEHEQRLLFPDAIRRVRADGATEEVAILVRPLRKHERRSARLYARAWAKKEGVDPQVDPQLFDDMDTMSILAMAIREPKPPYEQHQQPEWLEQHYDAASLAQVWDRYQVWEDATDPRVEAASQEDLWRTILEIGRSRSVLPLTGFAPHLQRNCILSMADLSLTSPTLQSFLESRDSSTAGPSR